MAAATDLDSASRARDHMANERTYLAWVRTAIAVMVLGIGVAKFVEQGHTRPVVAGALLVAVGAGGLFYAALRYRAVAREIEHGTFQTGTRTHGPIVATTVLVVAVLVAFVLILI